MRLQSGAGLSCQPGLQGALHRAGQPQGSACLWAAGAESEQAGDSQEIFTFNFPAAFPSESADIWKRGISAICLFQQVPLPPCAAPSSVWLCWAASGPSTVRALPRGGRGMSMIPEPTTVGQPHVHDTKQCPAAPSEWKQSQHSSSCSQAGKHRIPSSCQSPTGTDLLKMHQGRCRCRCSDKSIASCDSRAPFASVFPSLSQLLPWHPPGGGKDPHTLHVHLHQAAVGKRTDALGGIKAELGPPGRQHHTGEVMGKACPAWPWHQALICPPSALRLLLPPGSGGPFPRSGADDPQRPGKINGDVWSVREAPSLHDVFQPTAVNPVMEQRHRLPWRGRGQRGRRGSIAGPRLIHGLPVSLHSPSAVCLGGSSSQQN